jgi:hypothetical protein
VIDPELFDYELTVYLLLYPLSDDTSRERTLTDRLRRAKAVHYREYSTQDESGGTHGVSPDPSGRSHESTQIDQLRSVLTHTRMPQAGRWSLMHLIVAVVIGIIVGLVVAGAVILINV